MGSEEKTAKRLQITFKFLNFLFLYFFAKINFDGDAFVNAAIKKDSENKKTTGFGLSIMKEVCTQFEQKTGQYTKVKKQLSTWAKKLVARYQNEEKFSMDDAKMEFGNNDDQKNESKLDNANASVDEQKNKKNAER